MTTNEAPLTREDVLRLIDSPRGPVGLDLSNRTFEAGINLEGVSLQLSNLENSRFSVAFIEPGGGVPESVDRGAQLKKANLMRANLRNASLRYANLQEADLRWANLKGANLYNAKLSKAKLRGLEVSRETKLEKVEWGPRPLLREKFILGDEESRDFEGASEVYRTLKQWYTEAGMYDTAGRFYYREMEAKRKARSWRREPILKIWSWVLRILCGYGEKPELAIASTVMIILGMAGIYSISELTVPSSLYYSAVSFVALGYGGWVNITENWVKALGAIEVFIGVFMMALFLVTFTRKMTR